MILNHVLGLYINPDQEWKTIEKSKESTFYSLSHILLIALIPSLCGYYSAVHTGWSIGAGDTIRLTADSAIILSVAVYATALITVLTLGFLTHWMAITFGAKPTYTQTIELCSYTATPLFMAGFAALYPQLWFIFIVGLFGLAYSIYLLYTGVSIIMKIPTERGFIFASSVMTCGLIILVCVMSATAIIWVSGYGPAFSN